MQLATVNRRTSTLQFPYTCFTIHCRTFLSHHPVRSVSVRTVSQHVGGSALPQNMQLCAGAWA